MTTSVVETLKSKTHLSGGSQNIVQDGRYKILMGIASLFFSFYMLSNEYRYITLSSLMSEKNEPIDRVRRTQILSKLFASLMLLFTGFHMIYFYVPTNSDISLQILIKYLNDRGFVENDMFDFLQKFKAYRIEQYIKN